MIGGHGALRFIVQPLIAIALGVRDGRDDRRKGAPPYFWSLLSARESLRRRVAAGARQIAVPLVLAVLGSWLFQYLNHGRLHPMLAVLFATLFVAGPYIGSRGLANRLSKPLSHPLGGLTTPTR
jgi:hypothetical protein